jgi:hypothetical protein
MKKTKWIKKGNKRQGDWIRDYLIKNCGHNPMQLNSKSVGSFVSEGKLITDEKQRAKMESAWNSHLNRQSKSGKSISISKEPHKQASKRAKLTNQSLAKYIESLIEADINTPFSLPPNI